MTKRRDRTPLVDRLVGWSPLLLLAGLATLTWWLDAQVAGPGPNRDGNMRHDPDLFAEDVRAVELNKEGNAVQTLAASRARHYPDDGTVEFDQPRFVMTQPDRPKFSVDAERARVTGDRENAYFEGNVRATRAGETTGEERAGPITLATEYLHVIPKADRAQTDKPVTITESRGIIHANGLVLDNNAKTVKLNSKVRGTIQPPSDNK
ncbi:MAG TPA: LPS export ABC transporter periplasmic protein LptC [Casimicrobiaceae bacterium]|nr:LPS export ABC transporter periplasmic protein LptC [Casimicrobiaceae bacterium]